MNFTAKVNPDVEGEWIIERDGEVFCHLSDTDFSVFVEICSLPVEIEKEGDPEAKVRTAVNKAEDAFWAVIADQYPEVTSGDMSFDVLGSLHIKHVEIVNIWLRMNREWV